VVKIKLTNWDKGRNQQTFRPILIYHNYFNQIGVKFIDDGSYDIEFIGMNDFLNKKLSLQDSINYGLENISNKTGDYCLFDGSDSTSLMASYEVFSQSNAKYLFKTALTTQEQYSKPTAFNKWFFGSRSDLDLSYTIPDNIFNNIKLTGWNHGYHNPYFLNFSKLIEDRKIDICAVYQGAHVENRDHLVRNDIYYTNHRLAAWDVLKTSKNISYEIDKRSQSEFLNLISNSKCTLSPFGMGEICFRDFEIIQHGSVMIKPDMSLVNTYPNIYIPYETYIPCKLDYSDLLDKIQWVKENPKQCNEIINNAREIVKESYTVENLVTYWYNILLNFKNITT
jgi:hypothetical protein